MTGKNADIQKQLQDILKKVAESENVKNYEILLDIDRLQGDGILSDFFTGRVLHKDSGKITEVAIKKGPIVGSSIRMGNPSIYKNEVHFYSSVFPAQNHFQMEKEVRKPFQNIPKYFAGSYDPENMFVAMEDLSKKGYVLFEKTKYLNKEHLEAIFKIYGRFHALSFAFKQRNPDHFKNLTEVFYNGFSEGLLANDDAVQMMIGHFLAAVSAFDRVTEADIIAKLNKVVNIKETLLDALSYTGKYSCLVHGDCWSNNMLFKYKASGELEDIKLIDFQMARLSTPIHDLSYFFYSGAGKEDMDKLDYYLEIYYESFSDFARELGANPETLLPLDTLKEEWKKYARFGTIMGCQLWIIKLMDKEKITECLNQECVSKEQYIEEWSKKVNEIWIGKEYRERARNIYLHAVEYGIFT